MERKMGKRERKERRKNLSFGVGGGSNCFEINNIFEANIDKKLSCFIYPAIIARKKGEIGGMSQKKNEIKNGNKNLNKTKKMKYKRKARNIRHKNFWEFGNRGGLRESCSCFTN